MPMQLASLCLLLNVFSRYKIAFFSMISNLVCYLTEIKEMMEDALVKLLI